MRAGDIILIPLPQADGRIKNRPALLLKRMPPFGDWLVCGISSQLQQAVPAFDEIVARGDPDFPASGLVADSVIRIGFLAVVPSKEILGAIGAVAPDRHRRLLNHLSDFLRE